MFLQRIIDVQSHLWHNFARKAMIETSKLGYAASDPEMGASREGKPG
jgi:hypothetical protein